MRPWRLLGVILLLSACEMQSIHFADQPMHLTVHLPGTHARLAQALQAFSSEDPNAIPLTLSIDAEQKIEAINTLTHQQNVLAYQFTYRATVQVAGWPDQTFVSTTQLLLPVNQSVQQGDAARKTWAHLSDDLANSIVFSILHQRHFTDHA